ncbi:MAG TPA: helix-turn-helix domain-containing protein [Candidatus Saccharimonadales bacterium]|nr:helix-turn-helix domain-containing protein [Candidatus Saccharimonadales bacterium]
MKNYKRLSLIEREEVSRGLASGQTLREIASGLDRHPSTVSREMSRLRYNPSSYRATFAHDVALAHRSHRSDAKLLTLRT